MQLANSPMLTQLTAELFSIACYVFSLHHAKMTSGQSEA